MMKKNLKKTLIILSSALFAFSIIILAKGIIAAPSDKYWCKFNINCMRGVGCTCDSGTVEPNSCDPGYSSLPGASSEDDCLKICPETTISGFLVPEMLSGDSLAVAKSPCHRSGGGSYSATATCNNGVASVSGVSSLSCNASHYFASGAIYQSNYGCFDVCLQATCYAGVSSGYSHSQFRYDTPGGASGSKSITGGSCTATLSCSDGVVTVQSESCTCNSKYFLYGTNCLYCTPGNYCVGGISAPTSCPNGKTSLPGASSVSQCF